jgi:hypothetical protein
MNAIPGDRASPQEDVIAETTSPAMTVCEGDGRVG